MGISNWECRLPGCPLRLPRTWDPTAYPGVAPGGAGCRSVGHTPESPHLQVHRAPGNDPHFSTLTTTAPGSPQSWGGLPRFDLSVFLCFLSQLFFLSGSGLEFCTRTVWLAVPSSRREETCPLTPRSQLAKPQDGPQSSPPAGRCGDRPRRKGNGLEHRPPLTWASGGTDSTFILDLVG